jgi:uncharacterized protein (DUF2062 family)
MSGFLFDLRQNLKRKLPSPEQLARQRWLAPIAHRLTEHGLWHARTESVARGVAIGVFWAFVIPFAQVLFAAATCVWWRANIPVAAAITFVTNPLTVGGWLYLAYHVGSLFVTPKAPAPTADGWVGTLQSLGWPTLVGMGLFATVGAVAGYLLVRAGARLWFIWRVARRARRQRATARQA